MVKPEILVEDVTDAGVTEQARVELDAGVEALLLEEVAGELADLLGRTSMEG